MRTKVLLKRGKKKFTKKASNIKCFKERRELPEGIHKIILDSTNDIEVDYNLYDNSEEFYHLLLEQFRFVKEQRYTDNEFRTERVLNFIFKLATNIVPSGIVINLYDYILETFSRVENIGTRIYFDKSDDSLENYLDSQIIYDEYAQKYVESMDKKYRYKGSILINVNNHKITFSIYSRGNDDYYLPSIRIYGTNNIFNFNKLKPSTFLVEKNGKLIIVFTDGEEDFRQYSINPEIGTLNYIDILEESLPDMEEILTDFEMKNYGELSEKEMEKILNEN